MKLYFLMILSLLNASTIFCAAPLDRDVRKIKMVPFSFNYIDGNGNPRVYEILYNKSDTPLIALIKNSSAIGVLFSNHLIRAFCSEILNPGLKEKYINMEDKEDGMTPLQWELAIGNDEDTDKIKILIQNGADINITNYPQHPPLLSALLIGNTNYARLLIELGADKNILGPNNETALCISLCAPTKQDLCANVKYILSVYDEKELKEQLKSNSIKDIPIWQLAVNMHKLIENDGLSDKKSIWNIKSIIGPIS